MDKKPKIEDKPIYCHAWVSKISDKVMCNSIPCCGFCYGVNMLKAIQKEKSFDFNGVGRHPLVNGKFVFDDGTIHNPIKTEYNPKPIPNRNFDWDAYYEDADENGYIGHGTTESAAIKDLLSND